jgi:serine/threonine protein kinase
MSTHPPTLSKPSAPSSGTDHDALPPGTRFGEFEILRVVGVGGFGIVYLAQDHSLEREVALKEYMPASLAARGAGPAITVRSSSFAETYAIGLRSFINEARLLARFDHPSLVKVYRFWEDNATAYMVMPFLQGVTLRDARRGMPHAPDEAWIRSVLTPILSALELLHREGVYHRDIAPDNILLPRDGPPVLLDFGAARRVISDRTQSLTAILKPSYAPIEQYAEMTQLRQGPWTDIYALGAVVHYLLFGVPPAPATARAVQDDGDAIESRIVPGVSPRFLEAMSWMLAIRPNQRPQNGEQLRAVLDGRAEIPARGQPGSTVPGTLAPAGGPQIEQVADATRINTAYLPTHLPTARVAPASDQRATTTFSPKAPMPTARQTLVQAPPQRTAQPPAPAAAQPAAAANPAATRPQPPQTDRDPAPGRGWAGSGCGHGGAGRGENTGSRESARSGRRGRRPLGGDAGREDAGAAVGGAKRAELGARPLAAGRQAPRRTALAARAAAVPRRSAIAAASRGSALAAGAAAAPGRSAVAAGIVGGVAPCNASPRCRRAAQPPPRHAAAAVAAGAARRGPGGARHREAWRVEVLARPGRRGVFVFVAALAAWQFSGRRDAAVVEQATAASAAASGIVGTATTPPATPTTPMSQIIIETPDPAPTSALPKDAAKSPVPTAGITPPVDSGARAAPADRAAIADAGAASAARVRPLGKPVPRVGEDPPLASNNAPGTTRPPEPPAMGQPNGSTNDRHAAPGTTAAARLRRHPADAASARLRHGLGERRLQGLVLRAQHLQGPAMRGGALPLDTGVPRGPRSQAQAAEPVTR